MVYKERFIDPEQINEIIRLVREKADEEGVIAALVGGIAMQVYGSPRLTKDVDFALDHEFQDKSNLQKIGPITFGGTSYRAPSGGKVDLIVRSDGYAKLYKDALDYLVELPDGVIVVTPEHLAIMKQASAREQDILDLKWLIRQPGLLDLKKARAIAYRFMLQYGQDRFDDITDEALIEKEMKRRRGRDTEEE